jgi:ferritin-like metal-binding protein YciE
MPDNRETLRPYIADMLAVEKHIVEALERQQKDDDIKQFPNAAQLIERTLGLLRGHVRTLDAHLESYQGGSAAGAVKEAVTGVLGAIAGMYDKIRKDTASRALRDDYTALSLATVSYTMLHTTALGLRQGATADIALRHLQDLTPLIMELSEVVPTIVLKELSFEGYEIETGLAQQAVRNTQQTWSQQGQGQAETTGAGVGTPIGHPQGSGGSYTR